MRRTTFSVDCYGIVFFVIGEGYIFACDKRNSLFYFTLLDFVTILVIKSKSISPSYSTVGVEIFSAPKVSINSRYFISTNYFFSFCVGFYPSGYLCGRFFKNCPRSKRIFFPTSVIKQGFKNVIYSCVKYTSIKFYY